MSTQQRIIVGALCVIIGVLASSILHPSQAPVVKSTKSDDVFWAKEHEKQSAREQAYEIAAQAAKSALRKKFPGCEICVSKGYVDDLIHDGKHHIFDVRVRTAVFPFAENLPQAISGVWFYVIDGKPVERPEDQPEPAEIKWDFSNKAKNPETSTNGPCPVPRPTKKEPPK